MIEKITIHGLFASLHPQFGVPSSLHQTITTAFHIQTTCSHYAQENCAIAKMTAQCAL